mgnify:CR=1 FL=1
MRHNLPKYVGTSAVEITEITRHEIVDALLMRPESFHGNMDFIDFLKRVWNLSSMPSTDYRFNNAESDIWQHTINNNDWEYTYLLYDYLELRSCADATFIKFIETAVHPMVGNVEDIADRLKLINTPLRKDGFRLFQTAEMSGRSIYTVTQIGGSHTSASAAYEVVLSFAGEDRDYVEQVAAYLLANNVEFFYDRFEEATLWGKDLAEHLDAVYRSSARYCVILISRHYAEKVWPNHERRSALARAIEERHEYILPARFDDTELPGIRPTVGYVDLNVKSPTELGGLILQKLGRHT